MKENGNESCDQNGEEKKGDISIACLVVLAQGVIPASMTKSGKEEYVD